MNSLGEEVRKELVLDLCNDHTYTSQSQGIDKQAQIYQQIQQDFEVEHIKNLVGDWDADLIEDHF